MLKIEEGKGGFRAALFLSGREPGPARIVSRVAPPRCSIYYDIGTYDHRRRYQPVGDLDLPPG